MDRSVRWSVDPVRWGGPRTGGQCFGVTRNLEVIGSTPVGKTRIFFRVYQLSIQHIEQLKKTSSIKTPTSRNIK